MTIVYGPVFGIMLAISVMVLPAVEIGMIGFTAIGVAGTILWYLSPLPNMNKRHL